MPFTFQYVAFSAMGKRASQQDALTPTWKDNATHKLNYCVCDGMGGHPAGNIASREAVHALIKRTAQIPDLGLGIPPQEYINTVIYPVIRDIQQWLTLSITTEPDASPLMGTTLAWLHFYDAKAYMIWIGDSRIYHIRDQKIIHQTQDHTVYNDMLQKGVAPNEIEVRKHILSRCLMPDLFGQEQGNAHADVLVIEDIQINDFFLLCTDGVFEAWEDEELSALFVNPQRSISCDLITASIQHKCAQLSKDNYTFIVLELKEM